MRFAIKQNTPLTSCVYRMTLQGDTSAITAPGQFVQVQVPGFYLRRPISVCDWDSETLTLVYKVVGNGTDAMCRMSPGMEHELLTGQGNGIRQILPVSAGVAIVGHQPGRGRIEVAVKPICRKKNLAVCAGDRGQQVGQLPGAPGGPDDGKPDQRQRNLRGGAGYVHKRCVGVGVGAALIELEPAHGDRCAVGHHDGHACRLPPAVKAVNGEIAVHPGGDIHRRVLGLGPAPVEHHAIAGYAENRPCAAVAAHL